MTEVIRICDDCGGKADYLYEPPRIIVEGLTLGYYNSNVELCKNCMKKRCESWNNTVKSRRGVPTSELERMKNNGLS